MLQNVTTHLFLPSWVIVTWWCQIASSLFQPRYHLRQFNWTSFSLKKMHLKLLSANSVTQMCSFVSYFDIGLVWFMYYGIHCHSNHIVHLGIGGLNIKFVGTQYSNELHWLGKEVTAPVWFLQQWMPGDMPHQDSRRNVVSDIYCHCTYHTGVNCYQCIQQKCQSTCHKGHNELKLSIDDAEDRVVIAKHRWGDTQLSLPIMSSMTSCSNAAGRRCLLCVCV